MNDAVSWSQLVLVRSPIVVVAATLVLSLLGAPWLRLGATSRDRGSTSLIDRWKLFSWLHPFWAALLKWTLAAAVVTAAVCLLGPLAWRSQALAGMWDGAADLVRRVRP